mgnify:FL=1
MWTITEDHIGGGAVGVVGPRSATLTSEEIIAAGHHFRMYDDDGELYYEGYCTNNTDERAFAPLEHFGTPNAGCTGIKYEGASGKYEWL